MTTLSEYPGGKLPYWAVAIWYRCKFCKVCFQFEYQLVRHKKEKHIEEMRRNRIAAQQTAQEIQINSNDDNNEGAEEKDKELTSEEEGDSTSELPIPPVIDVSDALAGDSTNQEEVEEDDLKDFEEDIGEEAPEKFPEDQNAMDLTPVIIGCDQSDEELEISPGNSVHQLKHNKTEKPQLTCNLCDKVYKSASAIKRHLNDNHPPPPTKGKSMKFNCPFCKKKFLSQFMKEKHVESGCRQPFNKRSKKKIQIINKSPKITTQFQSKKTLIKTSTSVKKGPEENKLSPEKILPLPAKRTVGRPKNIKIPLKINPLQCTICDKTVGSKPGLIGHMKAHDRQKLIASKSLGSKPSFVGRIKARSRQKLNFACKLCNLKFKQKSSFTRHLIDKHSKMRNFL